MVPVEFVTVCSILIVGIFMARGVMARCDGVKSNQCIKDTGYVEIQKKILAGDLSLVCPTLQAMFNCAAKYLGDCDARTRKPVEVLFDSYKNEFGCTLTFKWEKSAAGQVAHTHVLIVSGVIVSIAAAMFF